MSTDTSSGHLIETPAGALDPMAAFDRYMVPISLQGPAIVRGEGSWVEDVDGVRYLDLVAGPGVVALGHSDPRSVEAISTAAATLLQSPGKYVTLPAVEYAATLAAHAPRGLTRTFFCNSGAEANEGAAKIAKKHQRMHGRGSGIIAFEHSFHGRTTHALAMTGAPKYKVGLDTFLTVPGVTHVPYPYALRCPSEDCTDFTLTAVRDALKLRLQGTAAAMIIEPVAAVGGIIVPPAGFLPGLRALCDEYDVLLVFDEVYTGFGRTGKLFASEHTGVAPDIMTMAKAVGGGLPLGGFMTTDAIAQAFAERREHFTTFGTNSAISCAAGLAHFRVLVEEDLAGRAAASGARLLARLKEAAAGRPGVAEVRGAGLLLGVEFADADRRRTPRPDLAARVQHAAMDRRVLVSVCGSYDSILRLSPPLNVTDDELDHAADVLSAVIADVTDGASA